MAGLVTCEIDGLDELEHELLVATPERARKGMRDGLGWFGDWMAGLIAAAAPRLTGFLSLNIVKKVTISAKKDQGIVAIGPSKKAWYASLVEFGSKHNVPPNPFIRRTFEQNGLAGIDGFAEKVKESLEKK